MSEKKVGPHQDTVDPQEVPPTATREGQRDRDKNGTTPIGQHEGQKYLRLIVNAEGNASCWVDVYAVLEAFHVSCPATAHAVKKLLCAGQRSKGTRLDDLTGALAALNRAIELERLRQT